MTTRSKSGSGAGVDFQIEGKAATRAVVLHVTGEDGFDGALARRERLAPDVRPRYRPYPFLRDEMYDAYAAADLVVGRAGSSTIAETTGTPAARQASVERAMASA